MKNQIRLHLEGERYGKLVVVEEAEPIYSKTFIERGDILYLVQNIYAE
ncbi:hypothetical protein [Blautia wexlerae]|nr:hypothetical protein [Blautia wexlerae]MZT60364.1 hypothetical protein [Blautia wexlerae]